MWNRDGTPEFRFINVDSGIQANPLRRYGIPEDVVHLASGQDPYKLIDLLNLRSRNNLDDELSDWSVCHVQSLHPLAIIIP